MKSPLHISPRGGSILCLEGLNGRIFRACSGSCCTYSGSLHSAKLNLDLLENTSCNLLTSEVNIKSPPAQRKTTLKWNSDGSLSSVDMTRILGSLEQSSLTACELSCEWNY